MSTRAHIIVKKGTEKCYTYHHCDGYPKGVGVDVREFLRKFNGKFSTPSEFCKMMENEDSAYEFENYGLHGDEEYVYVVDMDNHTYTCYNTKKNKNGVSWWDIPENEVYNCSEEFCEKY